MKKKKNLEKKVRSVFVKWVLRFRQIWEWCPKWSWYMPLWTIWWRKQIFITWIRYITWLCSPICKRKSDFIFPLRPPFTAYRKSLPGALQLRCDPGCRFKILLLNHWCCMMRPFFGSHRLPWSIQTQRRHISQQSKVESFIWPFRCSFPFKACECVGLWSNCLKMFALVGS